MFVFGLPGEWLAHFPSQSCSNCLVRIIFSGGLSRNLSIVVIAVSFLGPGGVEAVWRFLSRVEFKASRLGERSPLLWQTKGGARSSRRIPGKCDGI